MGECLDDAVSALQNLTIGVSGQVDKFLTLNSTALPSKNESLNFENHKIIGKYQVNKDFECVTMDVEFAKLISEDEIIRLPEGSGEEFRHSILPNIIKDDCKESCEKKIRELKQTFFLKSLMDNQIISATNEKLVKTPDFICTGDRISSTLQTPLKTHGNWELYAVKFNESIYLWSDAKTDENRYGYYDKYNKAFKTLLTKSSSEAAPATSEIANIFAVQEVTFGSHQLLLLNEIKVVDENEKFAEIDFYQSTYNSNNEVKENLRKCWAKCVVSGIEKVVLGQHSDHVIDEIEIINKVEDLVPKFCGTIRDAERCCYKFEDRLLTWIKSHFKENDPTVVKKFSWRWGDRIECHDIESSNDVLEFLLPKWFINAFENQKDESS